VGTRFEWAGPFGMSGKDFFNAFGSRRISSGAFGAMQDGLFLTDLLA